MAPPKLLAPLLLLCAAQLGGAHLITVCAATPLCTEGESITPKVYFFLGTYHYPGRPKGELLITTPTGEVLTFAFDQSCGSGADYNGPCPPDDIRRRCSKFVPVPMRRLGLSNPYRDIHRRDRGPRAALSSGLLSRVSRTFDPFPPWRRPTRMSPATRSTPPPRARP